MKSSRWSSRPALAAVALAALASTCAAQRPGAASQPAAGGFRCPDHEPYAYVDDHARLLTDAREARINACLRAVEARTGVHINVMTVRSVADYRTGPGGSIEGFARTIVAAGGPRSGPVVLLLVAAEDRRAQIELDGFDRDRCADARRIMNERITPRFKEGDYAGGIADGVDAIMLEFAGARRGWNAGILLPFIALLAAAGIGWSLIRHGKRGWGWFFVGMAIILLLVALKVISFLLNGLTRRGAYSGWHSAGLWGGGWRSSGGGYTGGGGGATGSW